MTRYAICFTEILVIVISYEACMLNAIMHVWNEEYIIASTVSHAYAQGCDNVFFIDNGSTDSTVKEAQAAGAHLVALYTSDFFDETKKILYINSSIQTISNLMGEEKIWWLIADADEFATPSTGGIISKLLADIPQDVRSIHGFMYNHIPTHPPYFAKNIHPADMMPLCSKTETSKIPLVRFDKGDEYIFSYGGAHRILCAKHVNVLRNMLEIHHFQYRAPESSFRRLAKLVKANKHGVARIDWMDKYAREHLNRSRSMYHERYESLQSTYGNNACECLKVSSLPYNFKNLPRWYGDAHVLSNINASPSEKALAFATYLFFKREYDSALCQFYEAFDSAENDPELISWILVKIAECFKRTNDESYVNIIASLAAGAPIDVKEYIISNFSV